MLDHEVHSNSAKLTVMDERELDEVRSVQSGQSGSRSMILLHQNGDNEDKIEVLEEEEESIQDII